MQCSKPHNPCWLIIASGDVLPCMYLWMIIIHVKDWGCSIFQGIPSKRCMKNHQKNSSRNIKPPRAAVYATHFPEDLECSGESFDHLTHLERPGELGVAWTDWTPWMWDAREKSSFWLVGMGQSSLDRYKWCIFLIFFSTCQVNVSRFYVSVSSKGLLAKCGARHRISIPRANVIS